VRMRLFGRTDVGQCASTTRTTSSSPTSREARAG
jgi:hypothetical protein